MILSLTLTLALSLLSGCAPPGVLPPPLPAASAQASMGGGGAVAWVGTLSGSSSESSRPLSEHLQGQVWLPLPTPPTAERLQLSAVLSISGTQDHNAAGALLRCDLSEAWFLQAEGGLLWGGVGFGGRRALGGGEGVWLYAAPALLWRDTAWLRLPVGVSGPLGERLRLSVEGGLTAGSAMLSPARPAGPATRAYLSVGLGG